MRATASAWSKTRRLIAARGKPCRAMRTTRSMTEPNKMVDRFGRHITYLRVSVTDRCDFRCIYCMSETMSFLPRQELLSLEEIDRLATAFIARGVRKLRLTGGEPLVRRNIMWLIGALSRHLGQ